MLYEDNSTQVSKGLGTAKEIMALVTGDDLLSIAKLFEPIALRATQEITNQIDGLLSDSNIADSVTDQTLIKILTQILKIVVTVILYYMFSLFGYQSNIKLC